MSGWTLVVLVGLSFLIFPIIALLVSASDRGDD